MTRWLAAHAIALGIPAALAVQAILDHSRGIPRAAVPAAGPRRGADPHPP